MLRAKTLDDILVSDAAALGATAGKIMKQHVGRRRSVDGVSVSRTPYLAGAGHLLVAYCLRHRGGRSVAGEALRLRPVTPAISWRAGTLAPGQRADISGFLGARQS